MADRSATAHTNGSSKAATLRRWAALGKARRLPEQRLIGPAVIRRWAILGASARTQIAAKVRLGIMRRFADLGQEHMRQRHTVLDAVLSRWNERLAPIGDPLTLGFGLNRWLGPEREEAYSDWFAWVLQEIGPLHLNRLLLPGFPTEGRYSVSREVWVPEGHKGHAGRLDAVVRFESAVAVIELKVSAAESSDTVKHEGYLKWLLSQQASLKRAILIATSESSEDNYGGFALIRWSDLCRKMRNLIQDLIHERRLQLACILAAFIGAVEQNLLGLPVIHGRAQQMLEQDADRVITYLEECERGVHDVRQ